MSTARGFRTPTDFRDWPGVTLVAALLLTAMFFYAMGAAWRADARADRAESLVDHFVSSCAARPDGSAECAPRTYPPATTTTVKP